MIDSAFGTSYDLVYIGDKKYNYIKWYQDTREDTREYLEDKISTKNKTNKSKTQETITKQV